MDGGIQGRGTRRLQERLLNLDLSPLTLGSVAELVQAERSVWEQELGGGGAGEVRCVLVH